MEQKSLKFHQFWSVWGLTILAIITALEPVFPAIQAALPTAWQAPAAVVILVLRAIKQGPKPPSSYGAGTAGLMIFCVLMSVGCMNAREAACVASVEAREDIDIVECDKKHGGKCPDEELDVIMDPYDLEGEKCLQNN